MKKFRKRIYSLMENMDVYKICDSRAIEIDWILEAGCHDGTDTDALARHFLPKAYYAFEPDKEARLKAELKFENLSCNINLSHKGLSNTNSSKFLKYAAEGKGSGSTSVVEFGEDIIEVCRFDDEHEINLKDGLLWLDVEGHAVQALEGMSLALTKVSLARIEVQLHSRGHGFTQDFNQVIHMMKLAGLAPLFGPIYPGYFGDIVFINRDLLSRRDKVRSFILKFCLYFFHSYLYPILGKPLKHR